MCHKVGSQVHGGKTVRCNTCNNKYWNAQEIHVACIEKDLKCELEN